MATKPERQLGEVHLKFARLSFPHLFKKTASVEGGKEKFRASFLLDPETKHGKAAIAQIEKAKKAVEQEVFGKTPSYKDDRCCFTPGEDRISNKTGEPYDGYEGMMVISASTDSRPTLLDRDKNQVTEEDGVFYAGCYVYAILRLWGTKKKEQGGIGLFASLEGVQFLKDGEAFGSAPIGEDAFDDIEDFDEDEDEDDDMLD